MFSKIMRNGRIREGSCSGAALSRGIHAAARARVKDANTAYISISTVYFETSVRQMLMSSPRVL
jgi:hypothetical protein